MSTPPPRIVSEENWNNRTLEDLNIVVIQSSDAIEFFGAPSDSFAISDIPHSFLLGDWVSSQPEIRHPKIERQFAKLLEDVGTEHLRSDYSVDLVTHILSVLNYDNGDFRIHRNIVTQLKMGGDLIECNVKAGISNGCEPWPSLVIQQVEFNWSPESITEKCAQAIGAAISVVYDETDYHIYKNGFNFIVPVIVVEGLTVYLLKVPVNPSLLKAVSDHGRQNRSTAIQERSVVEIFEAGEIGLAHGEVHKRLEVYRNLEAFKTYVLDLNQEFVAHRDSAEADDWENRFKLRHVRGNTPCDVDSDPLPVESISDDPITRNQNL